MNKKLIGLMVIGAVISVAALGYANHPGSEGGRGFYGGKGRCGGFEKGGRGHHGFGQFMQKAHFILENKEELGLTEEQVNTIKDLKIRVKKDLINLRAETQLNMVDIQSQLKTDDVNVQAVNALVDQGFANTSTRVKSIIDSYAKLKSTLTPEQKAKLKEIFKGKKERS